jgi:hypothetical protein
VQTFKKLREALSIAVPRSKQGLNDDGQEADIKSIEEKAMTANNGWICGKPY